MKHSTVTPLDGAEHRLMTIRTDMKAKNIDALLVTHLPSIRYITNFSGSNASLFILKSKVLFFTDDRYTEQVKSELHAIKGLETYIERDPYKYAMDKNLLKGVLKLGADTGKVDYDTIVKLRKMFRPATITKANGIVQNATIPKTPDEVAKIRRAADIQANVFNQILPLIKVGVSEQDLAAEITYRGRMLGAEKEAFDIIVVAGEHSAWVHGRATQQKIKKGDMITFDFGFYYEGFASDVTRTVAVGAVSKEQRKVYDIVRHAHGTAIAAAKAGMTGKELDAVARDIITTAGYGDYFKHSLGHGLGIEVHENPGISFRNEKGRIPVGAVITIEPGIYLPGKFGVRIEDDILITETGCEVLSSGSSELIIVE
ncbi:MAG: aminopeptidase P family protein [Ignavibacteria bacterium]|nr:aminopeptidase P family protein [Ignavibacteria bacterium]